MLVVAQRFNVLILHELRRSDIDQYLGSVAHLQVVILEPNLNGQEGLLVDLDGRWQVVVLAKGVAKLAQQLVSVFVFEQLLKAPLGLCDKLLCFSLAFQA